MEIFKDQAGEFRWHLEATNGEIVAQGEGYSRKENALNAVEQLRAWAKDADIDNLI
ncbi:MAG: DUF1508 domain-containing protein [Candidatus Paceibacterota bacterium]